MIPVLEEACRGWLLDGKPYPSRAAAYRAAVAAGHSMVICLGKAVPIPHRYVLGRSFSGVIERCVDETLK